MAALAQGPDVAVPALAMRQVVVEMGRGQHHPGRPDRRIPGRGGRGDLPPAAIPPGLLLLVPPAAVAQVPHRLAMRSATGLAAALGADEPDPVADLLPVDPGLTHVINHLKIMLKRGTSA